MTLFAAGIVAADQFTKFLVLENIPLHAHVDFLPGLLNLTYVRNTGAAFSSFEGAQWLFVVVFVLFTAAIVWEFSGKPDGIQSVPRVQYCRLFYDLQLFPADCPSVPG